MTDYFCEKASKTEKCVVVLSNGGCQRSHTVTTPDGKRHAFRHFGSGTFVGAHTYYPEQFIVNPIFFREEYNKLQNLGYTPRAIMHPNCMFTTPFDMIINQIVEEYRGDNRHGSCGMGIWETIVRNDGIRVYDFFIKDIQTKIKELKNIRDLYLPKRLKELGVTKISKEWEDVIQSEGMITNYIQDFDWMMNHVLLIDNDILRSYKNVVFENGQGLLLDQNRTEYGSHTTPSNTGIKNPMEIIDSVFAEDEFNLEVCYVTRSYMTRHGAGRFDTECKKEDINPDMVDLTNVPNPHQGILRYGKLDLNDLMKRIEEDSKGVKGNISLAITHLNKYDLDYSSVYKNFKKLYYSAGYDRSSVKTS